ncbi:hypothetical protein LIER_19215 [Lithospermum erythrorhizon]|uniref:Diacylglycerol O-acyltransferase n=1 Tax=Lithospermum erythrorhizon TaxID=34254 RepID=A0AAV3QGY4_LITER
MERTHEQIGEPVSPAGQSLIRPEINQVMNCVIAGKAPIDIDAVKAEVRNSIMLQNPSQRLTVSCPLSFDKPLWELHLLMAHQCAIFRIHHALGDGISLMAAFLSVCPRADDPSLRPRMEGIGSSGSVIRRRWNSVEVVKMVWNSVETINDVLCGVISHGLSKYIDLQSPEVAQNGLQITGLAMINLRPQPSVQNRMIRRWFAVHDTYELMENKARTWRGNKVGIILLPVYNHKGGEDPLQYVKRAKEIIDKKKCSLDPICSYKIGELLMSCFGAKMTIVDNPIDYIRVNSTSLPHALTMHIISYAGRADMQILVAKDIIPEPKILAKCFEDSLMEMKEAAMATT